MNRKRKESISPFPLFITFNSSQLYYPIDFILFPLNSALIALSFPLILMSLKCPGKIAYHQKLEPKRERDFFSMKEFSSLVHSRTHALNLISLLLFIVVFFSFLFPFWMIFTAWVKLVRHLVPFRRFGYNNKLCYNCYT